MRNKKSGLMTLNHNYGYFSGVGSGIAGNVKRLCVVVELEPQKLKFITNVK